MPGLSPILSEEGVTLDTWPACKPGSFWHWSSSVAVTCTSSSISGGVRYWASSDFLSFVNVGSWNSLIASPKAAAPPRIASQGSHDGKHHSSGLHWRAKMLLGSAKARRFNKVSIREKQAGSIEQTQNEFIKQCDGDCGWCVRQSRVL